MRFFIPIAVRFGFCLAFALCPAIELAGQTPPDPQTELAAAAEALSETERLIGEEDYTGAAELAGQALEIRRRLLGAGDPLTLEAMCLQGRFLTWAGEYETAEPLLREALAGRRRVLGSEHEETLRSISDLALLLQGQRHYDEAEASIRDAVETARRVLEPESKTTLDLLEQLGELVLELGRYDEAEPIFLECLESSKRVHGQENKNTANAHYNLGSLYDRWGKLGDALTHFDRALELNLAIIGEGAPITLTSIINRANVLVSLGRLDEAEQDYKRGLEGRRALYGDDHPRTLSALNNLGFCYNTRGNLAEAEECFRECLAGDRRNYSDEHPDTLLAMLNVGHVLKRQWKLPEADPLIRRALRGFRELYGDDHPLTVTALHNVASLLEAQGRLEEAEAAYRDVLEGRRRLLGPDSPRTITVTNNLGVLAKIQEEFDKAETLFRQALADRRRVLGDESPRTLTTIDNLGLLLTELGRLDEAEPLIREALAGREKVLGLSSPRTHFSRLHLGRLLELKGELDEAERLIREALVGLREVFGEAHGDITAALSLLAAHYYRRSDLARATATWTEAANSFESARLRSGAGGLERIHFAAGHSPLFPLAACLARGGKPLPAWERFEAGLARGLLDTVSARYTRPLTRKERLREADLFSRLTKLDERLGRLYGKTGIDEDQNRMAAVERCEKERDSLLEELAVFQAGISRKYGAAAGEVYTLARIQSQIPQGTALVGWVDLETAGSAAVASPGEHWACLVRKSGLPVWVALPGSGPEGAWTADDSGLVGKLREALGRRARRAADSRRLAVLQQRVRAQRIDPLEPYLTGISDLVVLPAGQMAGVPVDVLTDHYTVSYTPSGTMFAWLREKPDQGAGGLPADRWPLLALGDPVFTTASAAHTPAPETGDTTVRALSPPDPSRQTRVGSMTPLPGTRREVEAIARLFDPPEGKPGPVVLLGSEASEQRLDALSASGRLGTFRYIHLATHGVMDDRVAMRSALLLAQDRIDGSIDRVLAGQGVFDGWLTGEQIVHTWKLGADLVTLSGCETALGQEAGGEGYLGFSQALFVAGARSLVLSLWKVDDRATMLLMQRFYENMLGRFSSARGLPGAEFEPASPMPLAEALREAKFWLRGLTADEVRTLDPAGTRSDTRAAGFDPSEPVNRLSGKPYEDPRYWAAFILLGDPQ